VATSAELQRIPKDTQVLNLEDSKKIIQMIEKFEDDDDVKSVFHNLEMTEELEKDLNIL